MHTLVLIEYERSYSSSSMHSKISIRSCYSMHTYASYQLVIILEYAYILQYQSITTAYAYSVRAYAHYYQTRTTVCILRRRRGVVSIFKIQIKNTMHTTSQQLVVYYAYQSTTIVLIRRMVRMHSIIFYYQSSTKYPCQLVHTYVSTTLSTPRVRSQYGKYAY